MMKEIKIKVPVDCEYLSMWKDFDTFLPPGHIILNKEICGCGCTDYYLTNDSPVILVSPRRRLIESKLNDPRTASNLFYFDRSAKGSTVNVTIDELRRYLQGCQETPWTDSKVPKIMVTYDSMGVVIDYLHDWGVLDQFMIVVDEFTCIFTDVKLKGFTEINLLHRLNTLPNRIVYISATPLKDLYLQMLDEFEHMPIVNLEWDPSRIESANIYYSKMTSCAAAFEKIYNGYKNNGYFKTKIVNGFTYYSTEGVFFLNSVRDIVNIIRKCRLTPREALIICADEDKNRAALRKVGFRVGSVPGKNDYQLLNKPFTFVTKCSFEGTDFFSDNSTTFIFSDCNRDNMTLDISIDLPQIAGRCRSRNNVFRNDIYYYYKNTDTEQIDVKMMTQEIFNKKQDTEYLVNTLSGANVDALKNKLLVVQKVEKYSNDYLDVEIAADGSAVTVCNNLAFVADLRAIEIKSQQYTNTYKMASYMKSAGFNASHQQTQVDQLFNMFMTQFMADNNFQRKMQVYVDAVEHNPVLLEMIENTSAIPLEYKQYYHELGAERIRRCAYIEANLRRELDNLNQYSNVKLPLEVGKVYSNAEIKSMIQAEYNRIGMNKTAKATDIEMFADVVPKKFTNNNQRNNGYKIIKIK